MLSACIVLPLKSPTIWRSELTTVKCRFSLACISSASVRAVPSVFSSVLVTRRMPLPAAGGTGSVLNQTRSMRLPRLRPSSLSPLALATATKKNRLTYCPAGTV